MPPGNMRTSRHSPEGVLSIEQLAIGGGDSNIFEPVMTICAQSSKAPKMQFALNASTNVQLLVALPSWQALFTRYATTLNPKAGPGLQR